MKVLRAREMGMCFGVRDALEVARSHSQPRQTTIYGELVHNPVVNQELGARGYQKLAESERSKLPSTDQVLVTAHGISDLRRSQLQGAGKHLIDTTCPLVRRAHDSAMALQRDGFFVVIIGKKDHVEVQGIAGDLEHCAVVACLEDVRTFPASRIGIVCQTTTPPIHARAVVESIRAANPHAEIQFRDTICRPTRERQEAVEELVRDVDAVVVVGGRHSNNTLQLVHLAERAGVPVMHVEDATGLDIAWLRQFRLLGLTAGTSTLDSTIDAVESVLKSI